MLVVLGGAYAGKRAYVRDLGQRQNWISAYEQQQVEGWSHKWEPGCSLVMEGWDQWIFNELNDQMHAATIDPIVYRSKYKHLLANLFAEEQRRMDDQVILIILEAGKGVVPLSLEERACRDVLGWFAQDAVSVAQEVIYVWHGLHRVMKEK